MNRIERFTGEYEFLSNFYPSPIYWNGIRFPTVEHAFQAGKTTNPAWQTKIRDAATPGQAKRLGRSVALIADWETRKIPLMTLLIEYKFVPGSELADRLVATGDAELIEGNTWGDNFWGVDIRTPEKGLNWLGKILMLRRRALMGSR